MIKELIFVVDPMCSWCWGFSPVVEELRKTKEYDVSLVVGGLRGKGEMAWDENARTYLKQHWVSVAKSTGQPFNTSFFMQEQFEYDTYPACKAIVTIREMYGMQKAFTYLHLLQEAFYRDNQDITQLNILVTLVENLEVDANIFLEFYKSDRAQILMEHDFSKARSMGANAFPSIVMIDSDGHMICQKGYRNLEDMKQLLKEYNA